MSAEVWKYGLSERGDRMMGIMEACLNQYCQAIVATLREIAGEQTPEEIKEFEETYLQNVGSFEAASKDTTPLQRVMVGAGYTLRAIREWRAKGALFDPTANDRLERPPASGGTLGGVVGADQSKGE